MTKYYEEKEEAREEALETFDWDAWRKKVDRMAGSITDETFVEPPDEYDEDILDWDAWGEKVDRMFGTVADETLTPEYKSEPEEFDYHTREGWHKFVEATYGSITDETFMDPDEWDKNEKVLSRR